MTDNLRNYTLIGFEDDWKDSFRQRLCHSRNTSRLVMYSVLISALISLGLTLSIFAYWYSWNRKFSVEYTQRYNDFHNKLKSLNVEYISEENNQLFSNDNVNKEEYKFDNFVEQGVIREWLSVQT